MGCNPAVSAKLDGAVLLGDGEAPHVRKVDTAVPFSIYLSDCGNHSLSVATER